MAEFVAPSWDDIYSMCMDLADRLRRTNRTFHSVIAVSRGGLPPGRIMADLLEVRRIHVLSCEYYTLGYGEKGKRPQIKEPFSVELRGKHVLIVDDVADSGESLEEVRKHVESKQPETVKVAVIYVKPWNKARIDFHIGETGAWIIFPWERFEVVNKLVKEGANDSELEKTGIPKDVLGRLASLARVDIAKSKA